jgi:hypothetical protein
MEKNLTMAFMDVPCLFIIAGLVVSAYHGYRQNNKGTSYNAPVKRESKKM